MVYILQIGAMGVEFIADALKYNSTISTLDLRANGLGDEVYFCWELVISHGWWDTYLFTSKNTNLAQTVSQWLLILFLFSPFRLVYVQGAICLAQSLKVVNGTLTSLDLGFNEIRVRNFSLSLYFLQ